MLVNKNNSCPKPDTKEDKLVMPLCIMPETAPEEMNETEFVDLQFFCLNEIILQWCWCFKKKKPHSKGYIFHTQFKVFLGLSLNAALTDGLIMLTNNQRIALNHIRRHSLLHALSLQCLLIIHRSTVLNPPSHPCFYPFWLDTCGPGQLCTKSGGKKSNNEWVIVQKWRKTSMVGNQTKKPLCQGREIFMKTKQWCQAETKEAFIGLWRWMVEVWLCAEGRGNSCVSL